MEQRLAVGMGSWHSLGRAQAWRGYSQDCSRILGIRLGDGARMDVDFLSHGDRPGHWQNHPFRISQAGTMGQKEAKCLIVVP